jgi:hypothetical protein
MSITTAWRQVLDFFGMPLHHRAVAGAALRRCRAAPRPPVLTGIYNGGALTVSNSTFYSNIDVTSEIGYSGVAQVPDNINGSYTDGGGNSFK